MLEFFLFIPLAYAVALAAWPMLRVGGQLGVVTAFLTVVALAASPVIIPANDTILRGMAALVATDLLLKVLDFSRTVREGGTGHAFWGDYVRFLFPWPALLVVRELRGRRLAKPARAWLEIGRSFLAATAFAGGAAAMYFANQTALLQNHFFVDHVVKLALVVILVESASRFVYHLERLAGHDTIPPMEHFILSRSVGEFWCRWNTRVQAWLEYNVFWPSGGRRSPVRGVALSFLASAVLHEMMLGVATSRFDGYQFTFFLIQIPLVLSTRSMERFAQRHGIAGKALAHLVTIGWISLSSLLFFPAIDRVFPFFYVSDS